MIRTLPLDLRRIILDTATVSVLRAGGKHLCFMLEDPYRPPAEAKVPGRTCIPCGEYDVEITHSQRFGVRMPLVFNETLGNGRRLVTGEGKTFEGIRIHPGNTTDDTEGCLLPGRNVLFDGRGFRVTESRAAYDALFGVIDKAENDGLLVKLNVTIVT